LREEGKELVLAAGEKQPSSLTIRSTCSGLSSVEGGGEGASSGSRRKSQL
jgi:hypothetical protein